MKMLQVNPDLLTVIEGLARANPMEAFFVMTAVMLSVCIQFRGAF